MFSLIGESVAGIVPDLTQNAYCRLPTAKGAEPVSDVSGGVPSFNAARYVHILWRRRLIIVACLVLGLLAAVVFLLAASSTATASTVVNLTPISAKPFDTQRAPSQLVDQQTEEQLVTSADVSRTVSEALSGRRTPGQVRNGTTASLLAGSTIMRIKFQAPAARDAKAGADALAKAYLDYRSTQAADIRAAATDRLEARRQALRRDLETVNRTIANGKKGSSVVNFARSERQLILIELNSLFSSLNDVTGVDTNGGSVLSTAESHGVVATPRSGRILVTGGLVGLLLGLAAAFVRNALDRRLFDDYDAVRAHVGPILAHLSATKVDMPATGQDLDDMRAIRERLLALMAVHGNLITVIDETQRKAPSDLAANVALALAETGLEVKLVLVGYDDEFLGVLRRQLRLDPSRQDGGDDLLTSTRAPGLSVRRYRLNSEWFGSPGSPSLAEVAASPADGTVAVVAVPNGAAHADRLAAGRIADIVLVVAPARKARKSQLRETASDLRAVGTSVDGLLLVSKRRSLARSDREPPASPSVAGGHRGPSETSHL